MRSIESPILASILGSMAFPRIAHVYLFSDYFRARSVKGEDRIVRQRGQTAEYFLFLIPISPSILSSSYSRD